MYKIAGIDPGRRGAFATLEGPHTMRVFSFTGKPWDEVARLIFGGLPGCGVVGFEKVGVIYKPETPDESDDPYTAFHFGRNTGIVYGICLAYKVDINEIQPQTWQREFGLGGKFKDQPTRKRAHKVKAQELFPEIKVTLDICDAMLIAEYMWRKTYGELKHGKDPNFVSRAGTGVIRTVRSVSDI